jgi:hypothetical protein
MHCVWGEDQGEDRFEMNLLELKAEVDKARAEKEFREVMVWLLVCALAWSIA